MFFTQCHAKGVLKNAATLTVLAWVSLWHYGSFDFKLFCCCFACCIICFIKTCNVSMFAFRITILEWLSKNKCFPGFTFGWWVSLHRPLVWMLNDCDFHSQPCHAVLPLGPFQRSCDHFLYFLWHHLYRCLKIHPHPKTASASWIYWVTRFLTSITKKMRYTHTHTHIWITSIMTYWHNY